MLLARLLKKMLQIRKKIFFLSAFIYALLLFSPLALADNACTISDVSVTTPSSSVTTGTNIAFTTTLTANDTCTASTIQLVSTGQSTGGSLTISDPGSPYYYSNAQVSTSGTTKTFTATAGVADTYNYYVQTTFQTSPGSKSSSTGILRVISPSTLTISGTPTSTQNKSSGQTFTMSATISNPTNSSVTTSYGVAFNSSAFSLSGDASNGTTSIASGSSSTLSWTVTYSANLSSTQNLTLQVGDNSNAFRVSATSPATVSATPTPVYSASAGTSTGTTSTSYVAGAPTPAPTAAPTAAPTVAPEVKQLDQNTIVTGSIGQTSSTFVLSYIAGSDGFSGTLSYRLPFDYADYLSGKITFDPVPSRVRQGSVVADWNVDLGSSESFKATVTVAKQVAASVLEQFTAPTTIAATPTPKPIEEQPTVEAPTAIAATPAPAPAAQAGGIDFGLIGGIILLVLIAGGAYLYYQKSKAAQ